MPNYCTDAKCASANDRYEAKQEATICCEGERATIIKRSIQNGELLSQANAAAHHILGLLTGEEDNRASEVVSKANVSGLLDAVCRQSEQIIIICKNLEDIRRALE